MESQIYWGCRLSILNIEYVYNFFHHSLFLFGYLVHIICYQNYTIYFNELFSALLIYNNQCFFCLFLHFCMHVDFGFRIILQIVYNVFLSNSDFWPFFCSEINIENQNEPFYFYISKVFKFTLYWLHCKKGVKNHHSKGKHWKWLKDKMMKISGKAKSMEKIFKACVSYFSIKR